MHRLRRRETALTTDLTDNLDAGTPASTALVRDRFTWMVYLQLATYGFFLYSFTPAVTLLRDDEHTSRAISGLHGTGLAVGAVAAGLVSAKLIARFGRGRVLWGALAVVCLGVVIFVSCSVVPITIAGAIVAGFGGTILVNATSAALTSHHKGPAGGAAVTEANGTGSAIGLFAPLLLGGSIALGAGWRPGTLITVVMAAAVAIAFGRSVNGEEDGVADESRHSAGPMSLAYWISLVTLSLTTSVEFCMTIWSSDVLHNHDGLSKSLAAAGVSAIVLGMSIGRLTAGRLALRHSLSTLLLGAYGVTVIGFVLFWMSTIPWVAYTGLFITGLGISLHFPLAITRSIRFSDGRPDLATAYIALSTGIAIGVGPFGLGALADRVGSHTAILVVPVFVIMAAVGVALTRRGGDPWAHGTAAATIGDVPAVTA